MATWLTCSANAIFIVLAMLIGLAGSVADTSPREQRWAACVSIWLMSAGIVNLLGIWFAQRSPRYALIGVWLSNAAVVLACVYDLHRQLQGWGRGAIGFGFVLEACVPPMIAIGTAWVITARRRLGGCEN